MKLLRTLIASSIILATGQTFAADVDFAAIEKAFANNQFGEAVSFEGLTYATAGVCFDKSYNRVSKEALYIGKMKNVSNKVQTLAISTDHFYDLSFQPPFLVELLDTNSSGGTQQVENMVASGLTGSDNNIGALRSGKDFKYLYNGKKQGNTFVVSVSKKDNCERGTGKICPPPVLNACEVTHTDGSYYFVGCIRENDQTVFAKTADGKLVSKRTAEGWGHRMNNYSVYREPIETYCQWN